MRLFTIRCWKGGPQREHKDALVVADTREQAEELCHVKASADDFTKFTMQGEVVSSDQEGPARFLRWLGAGDDIQPGQRMNTLERIAQIDRLSAKCAALYQQLRVINNDPAQMATINRLYGEIAEATRQIERL